MQAISLPIQTHPQVKAALLYLSNCCVGKDRQGFNGIDTQLGHSLATACIHGELAIDQQLAALKVLRKYKKQLASAEVELPTTEQLKKDLERLSVTKTPSGWQVLNKLKGSRYHVRFDGDFWECECPLHRNRDVECKHIQAAQEYVESYENLEEELEEYIKLEDLEDLEEIDETSPPQVTLNEEQKAAISAMWKFYHAESAAGKPSFFLLQGGAGTGKTYTIQQFVKALQLETKQIRIVMCAPTNKATKVLERMAGLAGLENVEFATIFQLLGLKLTVDDDGKEKVEADPYGDISLDNYDLVVLDEGSMVSKELWKLINGTCRGGEPKVIFMGDINQLPPVGEVESKVFDINESAELTIGMRFGSVIRQLVNEVRDRIYEREPVIPYSINAQNSDEQVLVINKFEWLEALVQDFKSSAYKTNPDHVKAIAWTNKVVDFINTYVRQSLHGLNADQFIVGERLIALKPVTAENALARSGKEIVMTTSTECEVLEVKRHDYAGYEAWLMWVKADTGRNVRVLAIADSSKALWVEKLNILKHQAYELERGSSASKQKWREYYGLKEMFAPMSYCYAITCHKAQGSTFNNCYVALSDLLRNPKTLEKNRLVYTAMSRASQKLIISE